MNDIIKVETILREHRLKLIEKYGFQGMELEDFTLRSPESMSDNPFMRFIGYHYPVKIYRDITYIREKNLFGWRRGH